MPRSLPPSIPQCEATVTALARLHALWWNSPRIDTELGAHFAFAPASRYARRNADYAGFAEGLGDALLPRQRALYESILASSLIEQMTARTAARRNITLAHGAFKIARCSGDAAILDFTLPPRTFDLPARDAA